jgi:hypothetical protein
MKHICKTCGTQYPDTKTPPTECKICNDDRQYVNRDGQQWVSLDSLHGNFTNAFYQPEPNLLSIKTMPVFAIGQLGYLIKTPHGNILWECVSLLDDATVEIINGLGGIQMIAFSHPHFFSCMNEWAEKFKCKILIHEHNREWVVDPSEHIQYWSGEKFSINPDLDLYCVGGHFDGSSVLHWKSGANKKGVVLPGDSMFVCTDRRWVTFMHSFVNGVPLPAAKVQHIQDVVSKIPFDRMYGLWPEQVISENARQAVINSAQRYIGVLKA